MLGLPRNHPIVVELVSHRNKDSPVEAGSVSTFRSSESLHCVLISRSTLAKSNS
jgi:hypothetical protein